MTPDVDLHALERRTQRALRQLPMPSAPSTLLVRIMDAATHPPTRPWYALEWRRWPFAWQAASAAAVVAALAALVVVAVVPGLVGTRTLVDWIWTELPTVAPSIARATATLDAVLLVWRTIVEPVRAYVLALVAVTTMACALVGAALVHAATERMSRT